MTQMQINYFKMAANRFMEMIFVEFIILNCQMVCIETEEYERNCFIFYKSQMSESFFSWEEVKSKNTKKEKSRQNIIDAVKRDHFKMLFEQNVVFSACLIDC